MTQCTRPTLARLLTCSAMLLCVAPNARSAEPSDPRTAEVIAAWRATAKKYRCARVAWRVQHSDAKLMCMSFNDDGQPIQLSDADVARFKRERFDYVTYSKLTMDGELMRYEWRGRTPIDGGKFLDHQKVSSFNGTHSKSLHPPDKTTHYPYLHISSGGPCDAVVVLDTTPIRWRFGIACAPRISDVDLKHLSVLKTDVPVAEYKCILLLDTTTMPGFTRKYWVDPARDYAILRYEAKGPDGDSLLLDCEYAKSKDGFWLPQSWTATRLWGDGQVTTHEEAAVTECQANPAIAAGEYEIPANVPGMFVDDHTVPKGPMLRGNLAYIVREDGSHATLEPGENLTYGELIDRDNARRRSAALRPVWFGLGMLVVVGLSLAIFARLRQRRAGL